MARYWPFSENADARTNPLNTGLDQMYSVPWSLKP